MPVPTLTEKRGAAAFLASEANGSRSRDVEVLDAHTPAILAGTIMGRLDSNAQITPHVIAGSNGSEDVTCILYDNSPAAIPDSEVTVISRDAEVLASELHYPSGATDNQKAAINVALAAKGIIVRN